MNNGTRKGRHLQPNFYFFETIEIANEEPPEWISLKDELVLPDLNAHAINITLSKS